MGEKDMREINPPHDDYDYTEEYIGSVHIETMKKLLSDGNFIEEKTEHPKKSKPFFRKVKNTTDFNVC